MNNIIFGASLEQQPGEVAALAKKVEAGDVSAQIVSHQADGDTRYWGVAPTESPVLERLMGFATAEYRKATGKAPYRAFIMMNMVSAQKSPQGSGGAWHRDSFPDQYKTFVYLVDVDRVTQGPFCVMPSSNNLALRTLSGMGWLTSGRKNHDQPAWVVRALDRLKVKQKPVLAKAGMPFFANTSLIHRGMPISEGYRIAATVYMYKQGDDMPTINGKAIV